PLSNPGFYQSLPALGWYRLAGFSVGSLHGARNPARTRAGRGETATSQSQGKSSKAEGIAHCSPDLARGSVPHYRFRHDLHLPLRVPAVSLLLCDGASLHHNTIWHVVQCLRHGSGDLPSLAGPALAVD